MAIAPKLLAGTATVSVDGVSYLLKGDLEYQVSGEKRETLLGQDGPHGPSGVVIQGYISGTFRDSGTISMSDIAAMIGVTVVAELANGKTVIGTNGWRVGEPPVVKTEDGTFDVRWDFKSVTEA